MAMDRKTAGRAITRLAKELDYQEERELSTYIDDDAAIHRMYELAERSEIFDFYGGVPPRDTEAYNKLRIFLNDLRKEYESVNEHSLRRIAYLRDRKAASLKSAKASSPNTLETPQHVDAVSPLRPQGDLGNNIDASRTPSRQQGNFERKQDEYSVYAPGGGIWPPPYFEPTNIRMMAGSPEGHHRTPNGTTETPSGRIHTAAGILVHDPDNDDGEGGGGDNRGALSDDEEQMGYNSPFGSNQIDLDAILGSSNTRRNKFMPASRIIGESFEERHNRAMRMPGHREAQSSKRKASGNQKQKPIVREEEISVKEHDTDGSTVATSPAHGARRWLSGEKTAQQ